MHTLSRSLRRGIALMASRPIYLFMMVVVPVATAFFFLNLMNEGLPLKVPVAMVDTDHSALSRKMGRSLDASPLTDITMELEDYHQAVNKVRSGEIFGFFYIPSGFQEDALSGRTPTLSFYSNMSIFVPGTLAYKGFKTIAVTTSSGIVQTTLAGVGLGDQATQSLVMPLAMDYHLLGNPCSNYNIYLSQSFLAAMMALVAMVMTVFSIGYEIKWSTSPAWLDTAGGSMAVALAGKLLPQTFLLSGVGVAIQAVMFCWLGFPLNCPPLTMIMAMILLVTASQAFGVIVMEALPNLRLGLITVSLVGILSFSIAGFSFPVDKMYGGIAIFSFIMPIRYYFLIYIDQALNGIPLYYSRFYFIALLIFLLLPLIGLKRLRGKCLHPVYVP